MPPSIFAVGHSTHRLDEFIELLKAHGVEKLVDIRTVPRSATNPQFNRETLPEALDNAGIKYEHMKDLGGLRHTRPDSPNTAWQNKSFRGYADYMQTDQFQSALDHLIGMSGTEQVAIMCAEAVPWRCHRGLVADSLLVRGLSVEHIMSPTRRQPASLRSWARVEGKLITYID